jgi:hypothetical protein
VEMSAGRLMMNKLDDPAHWWSRADEAKTLAEVMNTPDRKRIMLGIAEGYEQLARQIERRLDRMRPEFL